MFTTICFSPLIQIANQAFHKSQWNKLLKVFQKAADTAIHKLHSQIPNNTTATNINNNMSDGMYGFETATKDSYEDDFF